MSIDTDTSGLRQIFSHTRGTIHQYRDHTVSFRCGQHRLHGNVHRCRVLQPVSVSLYQFCPVQEHDLAGGFCLLLDSLHPRRDIIAGLSRIFRICKRHIVAYRIFRKGKLFLPVKSFFYLPETMFFQTLFHGLFPYIRDLRKVPV